MIRLDQVGSTGAVDRKRVGRRRQTGLEIGEPTDSLSTLSAWYYEANVRSNVPPERERERENLPIHFYHSLSISKFRHLPPPLFIQHSASRNIFQLCLRRHSPVRYVLPRDEGRRLPSFRIAFHFPRLINFTRTRILIMTYMHRFVTMNSYDDESIERINGVFFFFFLSLFSLVSRILFFFFEDDIVVFCAWIGRIFVSFGREFHSIPCD